MLPFPLYHIETNFDKIVVVSTFPFEEMVCSCFKKVLVFFSSIIETLIDFRMDNFMILKFMRLDLSQFSNSILYSIVLISVKGVRQSCLNA